METLKFKEMLGFMYGNWAFKNEEIEMKLSIDKFYMTLVIYSNEKKQVFIADEIRNLPIVNFTNSDGKQFYVLSASENNLVFGDNSTNYDGQWKHAFNRIK